MLQVLCSNYYRAMDIIRILKCIRSRMIFFPGSFLFVFTFSGWSTARSSRAFSALANRPLRLSKRLVMCPTSCTWVLNLLASWSLATAFTRPATDSPRVSLTAVSSANAICSSRSTLSFRSNRDTRSAWKRRNSELAFEFLFFFFFNYSWTKWVFRVYSPFSSASCRYRRCTPPAAVASAVRSSGSEVSLWVRMWYSRMSWAIVRHSNRCERDKKN